MDLLEKYHVKSISGNSEEYIRLGIEPFSSYFHGSKIASAKWTKSKLNEKQIGTINLFPQSILLTVGGEKVALCHFANDVRCDFNMNSTWSYQDALKRNLEAYKQFLYTNSDAQKEEIEYMIGKYGLDNPYVQGFVSARQEPLFDGKQMSYFDAIIQGHVHFKFYESTGPTEIYTIRAAGMLYESPEKNDASYVILKEKTNNQGFDYEEVFVNFDREQMINSVLSSDNPNRKEIEKFTSISDEERRNFRR